VVVIQTTDEYFKTHEPSRRGRNNPNISSLKCATSVDDQYMTGNKGRMD
jgi:hypothetical protein